MTLTIWVNGTGEEPFMFENLDQEEIDSFLSRMNSGRNCNFIFFRVDNSSTYISQNYIAAFRVD